MPDHPGWRSMTTAVAGLAALVLLGAGLLTLSGDLWSPGGAQAGTTRGPGASQVAPVPVRPAARRAAVGTPTAEGARPVAVDVPALHVAAPVEPIHLRGGSLTPPADPARVGWWAEGARPGAPTGTAVLTGHTVHTGGGAFDDLEDLAPGDRVRVRTAGRRVDYEVRSVRVLTRDELARRSPAIFDQAGAPRLVLITCEDWDGHAYRSNVVVTADPST